MSKYICEKCGKEFKNYIAHKNRKTPCDKNLDKKKLGQFYTTNYNYILKNMVIPDNIENIIEPFVGNGDLLKFIENKKKYNIECYDIDPKTDYTVQRDTLNNPPDYNNKFILTNPPYLARNKNLDKKLYDKYDCNDLYKCFIKHISDSECLGGIIIVPLNFISSIRKSDIELRKKFLEKFDINTLNIFEEKVFNDTSYSVCSINFIPKKNIKPIKTYIYPSNKEIDIELTDENNYTIGGEIYKLYNSNKYKVERATKHTSKKNITNILLKCIDDNIKNKIRLEIVDDKKKFIDKTENLSARSYASLVIIPNIDIEKQKELVEKFNIYLDEMRNKYNSLFLTNYRESNSIARKRISFELAFRICNYLLDNG